MCVSVFFSPQVAFIGGILDVVTYVIIHSMGCCAVSSIKNLQSKNQHSEQQICAVKLGVYFRNAVYYL